jgi:hypothetical protein
MLSGDKEQNRVQRNEIKQKVYAPCDWEHEVKDYYHQSTYQLIKSHSNELQKGRYQLDIVKE